jgi:hypothetical protein
MASTRRDTSLEAEGAEFLVCGHLLIEGIVAHKAYTRTAGYDVLAVDALTGRAARVQVKSRWATDARQQFPIKNPDCDFVVYVRLNRGPKKGSSQAEKADPEFFILPIESVLAVRRTDGWGIARVGSIAELERFKGSWHLIRDFISRAPSLKNP